MRRSVESQVAATRDNEQAGISSKEDSIPTFFQGGQDLEIANSSFSLVLITLKNGARKKTTNDEQGSGAVRTLQSALRDSDMLLQDGDDYVALLPGTKPDGCERVADKLRATLNSEELWIGKATSPEDGSTLDDLLVAARSRQQPLVYWSASSDRTSSSIH